MVCESYRGRWHTIIVVDLKKFAFPATTLNLKIYKKRITCYKNKRKTLKIYSRYLQLCITRIY